MQKRLDVLIAVAGDEWDSRKEAFVQRSVQKREEVLSGMEELLSGMENIGISFPDGKNPLNVEFHSGVHQLTEDRHFIFWLGICPECGEPFLLGYLHSFSPHKMQYRDI